MRAVKSVSYTHLRQTKEPLTGATVQVSGTAQGAVADLDGNYTLELKNGTYTLTVRYIGYTDMTINAVEIKGETVLNFDICLLYTSILCRQCGMCAE